MSELGLTWERRGLGDGRYEHTLHIKPICYADGSIIKRINPAWGDSGIGLRPHMVSESKLMVSTSDDGDIRVHPTREQNRYFEFGAPYIRVGGQWVRPGFGGRTRDGQYLRWTTDYENAYLVHAGHYLKWGILLKSNWDRWSTFAMPVGLTGLTRQGGVLLADGSPVMYLQLPIVYDYDNEEDARQISYEFVQQNGQWYAVFTLPSLAGMSKPLIDPTFTLQPDSSTGIDTYTDSGNNRTIWGTGTALRMLGTTTYMLIKFDLSAVTGTVTTATMTLYNAVQFTSAASFALHPILAANSDWGELVSSWDYKREWDYGQKRWAGDTGNNGGADAGCSVSGTDYNSSSIGTFNFSNIAVNTPHPISLNANAFQAMMVANYGMFGKETTAPGSTVYWRSSNHATSSIRPKLVVITADTQSVSPYMRRYRQVWI